MWVVKLFKVLLAHIFYEHTGEKPFKSSGITDKHTNSNHDELSYLCQLLFLIFIKKTKDQQNFKIYRCLRSSQEKKTKISFR